MPRKNMSPPPTGFRWEGDFLALSEFLDASSDLRGVRLARPRPSSLSALHRARGSRADT